MTDYCRGDKAEDSHSREYRKYTQNRGYYPATVAEYEKVHNLTLGPSPNKKCQ